MAIEHAAITDPEIHEPKGISSASSGEVYIADGAGSGEWGTISAAVTTGDVIVFDADDLPAPSSGVITLTENTVYKISGTIDLGTDRIAFGTNSSLQGVNPKSDRITSFTTGNLFTASDSFCIRNLGIDAEDATIFSCTGSSTASAIIDNVIIEDASSLGTISGYENLELKAEVTTTSVGGLSLSGSFGTAVIRLIGTTWTGTLLNLGSATFDNIVIGPGGHYIAAGSQTSIQIAASGANINSGGLGLIFGNMFEGAGTDLTGYTVGDTGWIIVNNSGIDTSDYQSSLYSGTTETARAVAAASGGLEANNTSTGVGFERVLTVSDRTSSEVYTPSNVTTSRTFDADAVDAAALADIVGTLIADLQAIDIIQ